MDVVQDCWQGAHIKAAWSTASRLGPEALAEAMPVRSTCGFVDFVAEGPAKAFRTSGGIKALATRSWKP